jgi:hypothetical protein
MNTARNAWIAAMCVAAAEIMLTSVSVADDVYADVPPPAPKVEHAPPPRDGYVWSPGHWTLSGKSYYWVDGSFVVQRRHMQRIADQWEQVGDKWHFVPAHWQSSEAPPLINASR